MVPDLLIHALVVFGAASAAPVERTGRDLIPMIATELALEQREAMWIEEHELRWAGDVENVTSRNYLTIDYRIAPPPPLPENAELFR